MSLHYGKLYTTHHSLLKNIMLQPMRLNGDGLLPLFWLLRKLEYVLCVIVAACPDAEAADLFLAPKMTRSLSSPSQLTACYLSYLSTFLQ